jgi:hypothetical protein
MNRTLLIPAFIFLLFRPILAIASVDAKMWMISKNIKLQHWSYGGDGSEYDSQVYMLFGILEEFNKKYYNDTAFFYVDIDCRSERPVYELGFETINFPFEDKNLKPQWRPHKSIKLSFNGPELIYSNILKILYFGLTNQQYINRWQKASLNDSLYWYPFVLKPLINATLKQVIAEDNALVTAILNKRFYRVHAHHRERNDAIDYYYQNNQLHIYNTKGPNPRSSEEKDADTSGKTLGSFDKILSIKSDSKNHYLILVNHFCFYHLTLADEKISGPFYSPEPLTIDLYGKNLIIEDNKIRIHNDYYEGDFIFDYSNGTVIVDSTSIDSNIIEGIRQARNYKAQRFVDKIMSVRDLRNRQYKGVIIIIITILVNVYLARFKK